MRLPYAWFAQVVILVQVELVIIDPRCGQTKDPKTTTPDGGKINYDSSGNPVSYTSPSGNTTPLDGPPGC